MKHADELPSRRRRSLLIVSLLGLLVIVAGGAFALGRLAADPGDVSTTLGDATVHVTTGSSVASDDPFGAYRTAGWIKEENAKPGTRDWNIPDDKAMWYRIEGFADATSINLGQSVQLSVSTRAPKWQVSAYRIGYYGGAGARLVWRSEPQNGVNQPAPTQNTRTRTWTANWSPSLTIQTDATWPPGQYLLRLESVDNGASFVPLIIRDDASRSDLLVQSAVTTWQAYNGWGGASLYTGSGGRADVVSFDRPYSGNGSGEFLGREYEMISFIERLGFDVSYWTDIDLHVRGELARNHRAIVIPGHDEYYTVEMRRNLEAARDAGVNIAFFGANNVYRRIRLEAGPSGPARLEVNYRDAGRDPLNGKDNERVTTSFRESPAPNPESSLTGSYYECNPVDADWVVGDASLWMFENSGFRNGDRIPHMVGNEYDRVNPSAPTPTNISVLAHSPVNCRGMNSHADTTYYTAPSGAGVFDAATFGWSPRMITACELGSVVPDCKLQWVTANLLRAFAAGPAGVAHPSVSNLQRFGIATPRGPTTTTSTSTSTTTTTPR